MVKISEKSTLIPFRVIEVMEFAAATTAATTTVTTAATAAATTTTATAAATTTKTYAKLVQNLVQDTRIKQLSTVRHQLL